ncbi:MAG TPA: hypothetical protein PLQ89_11140 [Phycisphaerae bacterium]|nr:hypothetical protein [Phycisphaerae bacterium]HOM53406.1 hypothetical protein [Phycisphaerae bacterium]HON65807.1 hypothetical protein [Phycisphaerae bacterium]HOQ86264.1 hypothetical protein [Phycisphaerae bacterium]HPP28684.1 hypothetical protein [Phycisphaerae bacterium]
MRWILMFVLILTLLVTASPSPAQEAADESDEVLAVVPPPPEPASPPPGEEVMRPTRHGVRMTRRMAEAMGKVMARDLTINLSLDEKVQDKLARIITDRAWELKSHRGPEGAAVMEAFLETILSQYGEGESTPKPEELRAYSERLRPGVEIIREFWESVLDDADPLLTDEEYNALEQEVDTHLRATRRFEERLQRWSRGEVQEDDRLLDGLNDDDAGDKRAGKTREYRRAERIARKWVNNLDPLQWRGFLNEAIRLFHFDEAQREAGQAILKEYLEKGRAITTKEWKAKVMAIRIQEHLRRLCPDEPLEPWFYHLDVEYKRFVTPVQELGREFRQRIVALATPEQRALMLQEFKRLGAEHGMTDDEMAALDSLIPVAHTQPEAY